MSFKKRAKELIELEARKRKIAKSLSEDMRKEMFDHGIKMWEVSMRSGVSIATVDRVYHGMANPKAKTIEAIAKALAEIEEGR